MIAEPVTTVTDYVIALECLLLAGLLLRFGWAECSWAAAFVSVGVAAALGGTYHGFAVFLTEPVNNFIWQGTVLALAIASFLMIVASTGHLHRIWRRVWIMLAAVKLLLLLSWSIGDWSFVARVIDYLSALGVVLLLQQGSGFTWMASGIVISGIAAGCLIVPLPLAFNLSPVVGYHLVQMVALYCIYRSVRAIAQTRSKLLKS